MGSAHFAKGAAVLAAVAIGILGWLSSPLPLQAQNNNESIEELVKQGFAIAPVPLNLAGKDPKLVGLGSYLVNAIGDCNGCHSSGTPASLFIYPYLPGGNPYFGQPQQLDPSVYLNGGAVFPPVGTPTGPNGYAGPAIITRNLTPDYTGRAEGGHSLADFMNIIRNGHDYDQVHPNCTPAQIDDINMGGTPACIPTGVIPGTNFDNIPDGNLLQIMPWATFSHLTDHDITAIYEYLSSIPCIDNTLVPGPAGDPNELRNQCGPRPIAAAVQANDEIKDSRIKQGALRSRRLNLADK
jgi:hypothetical protein